MHRLASAAVFLPLALCACSDRALDTGLLGSVTGEPSPVSDNPSPIRAMSGTNPDYPTLGTVPPRPTDISTEAQRQTQMDRLARDRSVGQKYHSEALSQPVPETLPTPIPVPPVPNLTPGRR
ncbi:hypothetical protein [Azospirillum thermophilum]|uniref:hypothetical protein n=1 Tax=Azospirillum thermophilum TaxID=2202148 RepID=UPI001FE81FF5|nr:hypothetical protein [Azospirillum thermophilum]